jgi:spore coat protein U domain-containing protein, fimbrial subunit CupE1/2/3/6
MTKSRRCALGVLLAIGLMPAAARAACTGPLASATAVAFGSYNAGSPTDTTANGTVTVSCGLVVESLPPLTIALSAGTSGSFSTRKLSFGGSNLNYNLFTSPAFTSTWGDGTAGTVTESYTAGAHSVTLTVYGRLTKSQFVAPGPYSDSITVTVTF